MLKNLSFKQKINYLKNFETDIAKVYESGKIKLIQGENVTIYDIENRVIKGYVNNISEDLRDFLRRNGIKIYTDRFFSSMTPTWIQ